MAIDPLNPGAGGPVGTGGTRETPQSAPSGARSGGARNDHDGDSGDSIQISPTSIQLNTTNGEKPPAGTLSAEQLKTVTDRMTSGYYDQAAARSETVARVAKALGNGGN